MAISYSSLGGSVYPTIGTPPPGTNLRATYNTTTNGLSFPNAQVYVLVIGGGGAGGIQCGGTGGAVAQSWVPSPTSIVVGAGGASRYASGGDSSVGPLKAVGGYGQSTTGSGPNYPALAKLNSGGGGAGSSASSAYYTAGGGGASVNDANNGAGSGGSTAFYNAGSGSAPGSGQGSYGGGGAGFLGNGTSANQGIPNNSGGQGGAGGGGGGGVPNYGTFNGTGGNGAVLVYY